MTIVHLTSISVTMEPAFYLYGHEIRSMTAKKEKMKLIVLPVILSVITVVQMAMLQMILTSLKYPLVSLMHVAFPLMLQLKH